MNTFRCYDLVQPLRKDGVRVDQVCQHCPLYRKAFLISLFVNAFRLSV